MFVGRTIEDLLKLRVSRAHGNIREVKEMVYQELIDLMKSNGGTMKHEREGYPSGGVWILSFEGKSRTLEGNGEGSYTELDQLYVPKSNDLIDDAWSKMKALFKDQM